MRTVKMILAEKLQERLAKLVGGVSMIEVGSARETDPKEKKARGGKGRGGGGRSSKTIC